VTYCTDTFYNFKICVAISCKHLGLLLVVRFSRLEFNVKHTYFNIFIVNVLCCFYFILKRLQRRHENENFGCSSCVGVGELFSRVDWSLEVLRAAVF
jgi:hypothetical protein